MLTLPNYQIVNQIYESANSVVYRGHRRTDNQPVILKMLKQNYPTQAELTRYQQEYEITHNLDLAGVIKAYDIEKYQNTPLIILEDFGGESLKQLITDRLLLIQEFLPLAIDIADSLGHIHAANIIHKDINPSNIVVNIETKLLKIIDFGIASRLPRENPTLKNPKQLEGTLPYLSPEQTGRMNRVLDYRTDLYSLGVTFYELLTRKVPYESNSAMELVHCHIAKTPKPVSEINPEVPPIISDIIMKLMAKNADERYQSAFGLKYDLEKCHQNLLGFENLEGFNMKLAQNDFSGKLQIPQKLYGRENEINILLQAFERISEGATEMMLVAGYSGVGKTALVHEVHKPMVSRNGYFASGKFDQFQKNIPYFAITQAFNQFCRYLLMENAEILANWQTKILGVVGNNGQIIVDVIPDLELVIGPQPVVAKVGPTETQNRFNMFFLNFVKALCDKEHPFILFIDDLQWIDSGSLNLLKSILLDDEIKHLFIIGAYRDNEVDSSHPFIMTISELQKAKVTINTIGLANLQADDINQLLQESLWCEAKQTQPLTDLVYQKTQGNAFFTHQFLHTLYFEALLHFDFEQLEWQWDVEQIATQNITANVVELMANQIDKLPSKTSKALQLAACIGNQFDLSVLAIIAQQDKNETLSILWDAIVEGLIQPLEQNYKHLDTAKTSKLKFLHDRVQQAAYALIDDKQKQTIHLQIGRLLLKNTPTDTLENKVFEIVEQFNYCNHLLQNKMEIFQVAELNLLAGKKAKMATAYKAAFNYLTKGRECLSKNSWESEYDLTLNLFTEAVEVAYLCGDFLQQEQLAKMVLNHAHCLLDKVTIYEVNIQAYIAQHKQLEAIETALPVLKQLGVEFPEHPHQEDIELKLQETQSIWAGKPIESLCNLPMMTVENEQIIMRILANLLGSTYEVAPELFTLIVCKQIQLSIKHGNLPVSAYCYACYGIVQVVTGDIETGYQFGQLALNLLEKLDAKEFKAKILDVVQTCIKPWKIHFQKTLQPLQDGYYSGLEVGGLEHATYCGVEYCANSYYSGRELAALEQEMASYTKAFRHLKQEISVTFNEIYRQGVLNLMGQAENPCRLIGEAYNEDKMLPIHLQKNDLLSLYLLYAQKIILCCLFQDNLQTIENVTIAQPYVLPNFSIGATPIIYLCDSLARLAVYPNCSMEEQKLHLDKVQTNQEQMEKWAKHAPMNFLHKFYLVEAERCRVLDKNGDAREFYDQAIALAHENEYLNEEALAYELAAEFYLERRMEKFAQIYLKEAHYCYQQWGALAKVVDLETKYPQLLTTQKSFSPIVTMMGTIMTSNTTGFQTSTVLDLDSVTKASQTLAGEIILSKLLEKMMHLVIENAGAERGFLLLSNDDKWVIEAEGAINQEEVTLLCSLPIENDLPVAIINYVARTQENVVLANASSEGVYTENEYIKAHQTQSILCFPIVYQQQLRAILYLENNLSPGAFTPQRLNVLQMLSSQIAISLENAEYANHLEEKVKQRTTELAQANQEIMALNERLEEENLRMSAELDVAKQLQQMVLPKETELEQIENLDLAGFMAPADEVGGDYYEILNHNGHIKIGIGDVTGHGLESGVLMLMVQTTVRALLLAGIDNPEQFLNILNQTIYHNAQRMGTDKNLTLSLLDYQKGTLQLTGQHEDVLLVRRGGQIERIDTVDLGFMIGVKNDILKFASHQDISLQPGDGIVLYTDGITEAQNLEEALYGIDRLCEVVSRHWSLTAQAIQQAVVADVKQYIGTQKVFDDITLLVLKQK